MRLSAKTLLSGHFSILPNGIISQKGGNFCLRLTPKPQGRQRAGALPCCERFSTYCKTTPRASGAGSTTITSTCSYGRRPASWLPSNSATASIPASGPWCGARAAAISTMAARSRPIRSSRASSALRMGCPRCCASRWARACASTRSTRPRSPRAARAFAAPTGSRAATTKTRKIRAGFPDRAEGRSFHLGARGDDDLRPLRRLGGDDLAEVLRRAFDRLAPQLRQARQHIGITEGPVHFGIELLDDLRRRPPGHSDSEPRGGLVAGHGLGDGR